MHVFCGLVMMCNSVVSIISNVTGVKWKKNHSGWREKQEEIKVDWIVQNLINTANKKKKKKKKKLYYCEICGSMIFNGSSLQG